MRRMAGSSHRRLPGTSSRYPLTTNSQQSITTNTAVSSTSTTTSANGTQHSSSSSESLLVAYTIEGFTNTLAKRVNASSLTLEDFKEKVFNRRGHFR